MTSRLRCAAATALVMLFAGAAAAAQTAGAPAPLPAYRNRLLGVFDGQTGEPIEGAQVTDAMNKVSALTPKTGTVTLIFLPEGGSVIRIQKLGYQPATILALISPADTVPVTVVLNVAAQALPAVITTDSSPHYISPGLREFEARRKPNIYLDGSPYLDDHLEQLNVIQLAGVEYYAGPASVPPQYNRTGSTCGVMIFLTRER